MTGEETGVIQAGLLTTVTAESVHFGSIDDIEAARDEMLRVTNVFETGEEVHDRESLFRVLASTLKFPDYFGGNWDAVVDCLRGVEAIGARRGLVLVWHHARSLWHDAAESAGTLVEIWLSVAEERRISDEPFHLVFVW